VHEPTTKAWASDAQLVASILAGSRQDFDLLYETYFPRVYRFAQRRLHDAAESEDVTQEVFLAVFRSLPSFQGTSSLLVWIFGIARNTVNRRFRRNKLRLQPLESDQVGEVPGNEVAPDQAVEARRILASCEAVIEKELTPLQRRIFHLKHLRRQSIRTIAAALGKSEDAIKANLYRMRRSIASAAPELEGLLGI
jgi:RNA polymerase sigma-70 factor (ECF subfamily)